jgi:hypothetical protein
VVAIPRAALSVEALQATIEACHGVAIPVAELLEAPFIAPVCVHDLWAMGERIKLVTAWLTGEAAPETLHAGGRGRHGVSLRGPLDVGEGGAAAAHAHRGAAAGDSGAIGGVKISYAARKLTGISRGGVSSLRVVTSVSKIHVASERVGDARALPSA